MNAQTAKGFVLAGALLLVTAGCATDTDTTEVEGGAKVIEAGKLTVCTHLPYKPFQYNEGGEVVGFDVDLMDLVAKKLDLEQEIFNTPFEKIETGVSMSQGDCDIAAAGMTITEDRGEVMDFSDPYFDATQALLVQKGAGYASLDDLSGKTVGVQTGTTGKLYAEDNASDEVEIRTYEDLALLTAAVKAGKIDAGINDNTVLYDYVADNPDLEVATEFDTGEQYGFAVAKDGNDELIATANEVLAQSREDGTYDALYKKYFGGVPQK